MARYNSNNSSGCLGIIGIILLIGLAIFIYSYCWILAIPALIYFIKSKKFENYRKRNVIICSFVLVTSLLTFGWLNLPKELESISVDWGSSEFDISETVEVEISPYPDEADIETLELSQNSIADLDYSEGKAIITFKKAGEATLFFTANGKIQSNTTTITVTDSTIESSSSKQAKEQSDTQETTAETQEITNATTSSAEDPIVYITNTGSKYHSAGCRTLKSQIEKHLSEVQGVYEPCGICHPPQ